MKYIFSCTVFFLLSYELLLCYCFFKPISYRRLLSFCTLRNLINFFFWRQPPPHIKSAAPVIFLCTGSETWLLQPISYVALLFPASTQTFPMAKLMNSIPKSRQKWLVNFWLLNLVTPDCLPGPPPHLFSFQPQSNARAGGRFFKILFLLLLSRKLVFNKDLCISGESPCQN